MGREIVVAPIRSPFTNGYGVAAKSEPAALRGT